VRRGKVEVTVRIHASAQEMWDAVTDWQAQGEWMPATRVRAVESEGQGVGGKIEAFTGYGRIGFLDSMVVTEWRPPAWCAVRHTGRFVRGTGGFAIEEVDRGGERASDEVRLTWHEDLELPAGALGALGWGLLHPLVRLVLRRSLTRLGRSVEKPVARP
jgi:carbon monoxide dehydrogenase subunit G